MHFAENTQEAFLYAIRDIKKGEIILWCYDIQQYLDEKDKRQSFLSPGTPVSRGLRHFVDTVFKIEDRVIETNNEDVNPEYAFERAHASTSPVMIDLCNESINDDLNSLPSYGNKEPYTKSAYNDYLVDQRSTTSRDRFGNLHVTNASFEYISDNESLPPSHLNSPVQTVIPNRRSQPGDTFVVDYMNDQTHVDLDYLLAPTPDVSPHVDASPQPTTPSDIIQNARNSSRQELIERSNATINHNYPKRHKSNKK